MSRKRAIDAICLKKTDKLPIQENIDNYEYIKKVTKIDPLINPIEAYREFYKYYDVDMIFHIPTKIVTFKKGESSKVIDGVKYTKWGISGSAWNSHIAFKDISDILAYDPRKDNESKILTKNHNKSRISEALEGQDIMGDAALVTGLYYTTLFMFPLMLFGWELFLTYALQQKKDFLNKIKIFTEISIKNVENWINSGIDVFISHDDLAIASGLVFPRSWYHEFIFPYYKEIWNPLKRKGIKLIFVSDGHYFDLIDDLFELGIDGVFIDQSNDLKKLVSKYGGKKVLIGNVDTAKLTFGSAKDVGNEVKRVISQTKKENGCFIKASGDLPHNIPLENMETYFETIRKLR